MAEVPANQTIEKVLATHYNHTFAAKAAALTPTLHETTILPISIVKFVPDASTFFKYRLETVSPASDLPSQLHSKGSDFILDFGTHHVGYLSFHLAAEGINIDAPCRLKLTFGEVAHDVAEELQPCNTWISTSWIPEEVITVDWPPQDVEIARRHAFRYVRVQVIDTSPKYQVAFRNARVKAVSAVDPKIAVSKLERTDAELVAIDRVAQRTLRDCMQTVFEDGPRRDRRMWLGDLRLQALSSYYTHCDFQLVKRCLYMFAALPREDRSLPATLFEFPQLRPATDYIVDYDALFGATVFDYVVHSGDIETGEELWETVIGSMTKIVEHITPDGTFDCNATKAWKFTDWAENVELDGAMHGLTLYCCKRVNSLAELLGKRQPFKNMVFQMSEAVGNFVDQDRGLFISGSQKQITWTTAAWLCLSGAFPASEANSLLLATLASPEAIKPLTPYAWHHVAEALAVVGAEDECVAMIKDYWGGMVRAGADTFWECYDPEDCYRSPYGDSHNNSWCHAWSCTPSYLLRGVLAGKIGADGQLRKT